MPHHLCGVYSILTIFNQDRPNPNRKKQKKITQLNYHVMELLKMSHALSMQTQKSIEYHECVSITSKYNEWTNRKKNSIESSECLKCPTLGLNFYAFHNNCLFTEKSSTLGKKPLEKNRFKWTSVDVKRNHDSLIRA